MDDKDVRVLRHLAEEPKGRAVKGAWLDRFAEYERLGFVLLSGARTGLFPDREVFWAKITEAGRKAVNP